MSHQPVIDGFEFASAGATQQGVWRLSDFPRLRDMLATDAGEVKYEIGGTRDERGRPALRLKVSGTLALRELIEDELILAVPYAPRHESCIAAGAWDSAEKVSPFAGLRGLMRKH